MKILIIENQEKDALDLQQLILQADPGIDILDKLTTVEDAVRWLISRPQPDLIFLDVQLDDGISFDIFQEVKTNVPLIFTTLNASWAVRAFRLNTIGYLMKPLDINAIISILYKYKSLSQYYTSINPPSAELEPLKFNTPNTAEISPLIKHLKKRFLVHLGDKIRYIPLSDVAWFKADGNSVYLVTKHNDRLILDETLEEIHEVLDSSLFFRLNRTYICHLQALKDIRKYFNSRLKITLQPEPGNEEEVLVSRNRVHQFLSWLGS